MQPTIPDALCAFMPLLALASGAAIILLLSVAGGEKKLAPPGGVHLLLVALLALALAAARLVAAVQPGPPVPVLGGALVLDGLGVWFGCLACLGTALTAVLALPVLVAQGLATGEYFALLLLACAGAVTVGMAGDLLTLFLAIEMMSVPAYVLAGFRRASARSQEAALKYFLYGAFASAFIVFGMALAWGESGRSSGTPTLVLHELAFVVQSGNMGALGQIGLVFILVGLCFKVAAVPFHMWAPDVYEGAPTPSAGFMSVVVKSAGFAALVRFVAMAFASAGGTEMHLRAVQLFVVLSALSVVVGNVLAVRQQQVKRMLAYSSIAHAGYGLVGIVAMVERPGNQAVAAIGYYLLCYAGMATGAFAVVSALEGSQERHADFTFERLAGSAYKQPLLAVVATVCMLGLAGIPPTSGFFGKAAIFSAAVSTGHVGLVILAALASVVGAYSYLRVLALMFMRRAQPQTASLGTPLSSPWLDAGLLTCAGLTVGLGVFGEPAYALARATLATWWLGV